MARNHFKIEDFEKSDTASRFHLDNHIPEAYIQNVNDLIRTVLNPIWDAYGPFIVTSGFRSSAVNKQVRGAAKSDHLFAAAADIRPADRSKTRDLWECIMRLIAAGQIAVRQVIWEYGSAQAPRWVHVSVNNAFNSAKSTDILAIGVDRRQISGWSEWTKMQGKKGSVSNVDFGAYVPLSVSSYSCSTMTRIPPVAMGISVQTSGIVLTGSSVYYNENIEAVRTVIDEESGEEVEETVTIAYDAGYEPDPEEVEEIHVDLEGLTLDTVEKIGGVEYNIDGTYTAQDLKTAGEVLQQAENMSQMATLLSHSTEDTNSLKSCSYLPASGGGVSGAMSAAQGAASTAQGGLSGLSGSLPSASSGGTTSGTNLGIPRVGGTGNIEAVVSVASSIDKYGKAIMKGCACPVCGKRVKFMPVQGFCSIECFTQDLTQRIMLHAKRKESDPVLETLERIRGILDYLNIVLNLLTDLPDLLKNIAVLPDALKEFVMFYVNGVFILIRMVINKLLIKKNEGLIYALKYVQRGLSKPPLSYLDVAIDTVQMAIDVLVESFEIGYSIAMKALSVPGVGIDPESYAWICTPRAIMNGDWQGNYIMNLPNAGLMAKAIPTMCNIAMPMIDNVIKNAFPPIQSVEYFYDPALFDVRLLLSDQSNLVKLMAETLEMLMAFGCDYFPRYKRLSLINPWFILAILDGWAPHSWKDFGSLLQPMV